MLKEIWISLPVSLFCVLAQAQANKVTTASTTPVKTKATVASTTPTNAKPTASKPVAGKPTTTHSNVSVASSTPSNTLAPTPSAATSVAEPKKEEAAKLGFSFEFDADYTVGAKKQPDGTQAESLSYTFIPAMSYGDYTLMAVAAYGQDLKDTAKTGSFYDPSFTLSRKSYTLGKYFKLGPSATLVLPMTDSSKNNTGLLYSVSGTLSLSLQTKALGLDNWFSSYSVNYNKNYTNFSTTASGEPITASRIRQRFNVGYNFTDKLSFMTRLQIDSKYSVEGVIRNDFLHFQTLSYQATDVIGFSMGHANSGGMLNDNYENNLKFFDDASSEYSVGIAVTL